LGVGRESPYYSFLAGPRTAGGRKTGSSRPCVPLGAGAVAPLSCQECLPLRTGSLRRDSADVITALRNPLSRRRCQGWRAFRRARAATRRRIAQPDRPPAVQSCGNTLCRSSRITRQTTAKERPEGLTRAAASRSALAKIAEWQPAAGIGTE